MLAPRKPSRRNTSVAAARIASRFVTERFGTSFPAGRFAEAALIIDRIFCRIIDPA
jgi:hypothetical protein